MDLINQVDPLVDGWVVAFAVVAVLYYAAKIIDHFKE